MPRKLRPQPADEPPGILDDVPRSYPGFIRLELATFVQPVNPRDFGIDRPVLDLAAGFRTSGEALAKCRHLLGTFQQAAAEAEQLPGQQAGRYRTALSHLIEQTVWLMERLAAVRGSAEFLEVTWDSGHLVLRRTSPLARPIG